MTLIAAVSADGFISKGQGVPWNLPRDKAHFRQTTAGQWLLIGRRTYQEMLGWFKDHHPLVLTRDVSYVPQVGQTVTTVSEALQRAAADGAGELFVCGGGEAYAAAMPFADKLIITRVEDELHSGVPFPPILENEWRLTSRESFPADADNPLTMAIEGYAKQNRPQMAP